MSDEKFPLFKLLATQEEVSLDEKKIGLLLPSTNLVQHGVVFVGGEVRPNWSGQLVMEFQIWQPITIRKGMIIGHIWIFEDENPISFEPTDCETIKPEEGLRILK